MKKLLKIFITGMLFCLCAVVMTGCSVKNGFNQLLCEHEYDDGIVTIEATCSEYGELTKTCELCGKEEKEKIEKTSHTSVYVEAVAATCDKVGYTDSTKCLVCDAVIIAPQELPALGHVVVLDKGVEATCLTAGLTDGNHCSRCDKVLVEQKELPATGHKLIQVAEKESTCAEKGHNAHVACAYCDTTYGKVEKELSTIHNYSGSSSGCNVCGSSNIWSLLDNENNYTVKKLDSNSILTEGYVYRVAYNRNECNPQFSIKVLDDSGNEHDLIFSYKSDIGDFWLTLNDTDSASISSVDCPDIFVQSLIGDENAGFSFFRITSGKLTFSYDLGNDNFERITVVIPEGTLATNIIEGEIYQVVLK